MSDGGYEHDSREAENAMAAAGHPDIALGMRRHSEAQRNMMQGVLVPMFVKMVERSLKDAIAPLGKQIATSQKETQDAIGALGSRFQVVEQDVQGLADRMDASEADRAAMRAQLAALDTDALSDIRQRLAVLEDWKEQLAALRAEFSALSSRIGGALPTEADQDLSAALRAERSG